MKNHYPDFLWRQHFCLALSLESLNLLHLLNSPLHAQTFTVTRTDTLVQEQTVCATVYEKESE